MGQLLQGFHSDWNSQGIMRVREKVREYQFTCQTYFSKNVNFECLFSIESTWDAKFPDYSSLSGNPVEVVSRKLNGKRHSKLTLFDK